MKLSALALLPLLTPRDYGTRSQSPSSLPASYGPDGNEYLNAGLPASIFHNLAQYAPRFTVNGLSDALPEGCSVTLVNSLERHGVRYMTSALLTSAQTTLAKIQSAIANVSASRLPSNYRFLKHVTVTNYTADLTPLGALQAYYSGKYTRELYKGLASESDAFIRTSGDPGADRVIVTSQFWSMGYHGQAFPSGLLFNGTSVRAAGATASVQPNVVISEKAGQNNTLSVSTCTADTAYGNVAGENLANAVYGNSTLVPVIGARLDKAFAKAGVSLNLTYVDVSNLLSFCAFASEGDATVSSGKLNISVSPFCHLFKDSDFILYEYFLDVGKYYGSGYGDPYHKALGMGYLRELLARITSTEVDLSPPTSLNTTLDTSGASSTFPIPNNSSKPHGPRIFHDASHDNNISPIAAAFGLFGEKHHLPLTYHAERSPKGKNRNWRFSNIAPLQGKIVWEKVTCSSTTSSSSSSDKKDKKQQSYLRIRANEAIQPTEGTGITWCPAFPKKIDGRTSKYGLCPLENVVSRLQWVKSTEWNKCYAPAVTTLQI